MKWRLESLEVGDNIVALFLAQQLFVSWHSVAAGLDQRPGIFFRGLRSVCSATVPGRVNTRLQPLWSPVLCAELRLSLVGDVIAWAHGFRDRPEIQLHTDSETAA